MTNTKTTRNAFLASVLSLVLCASMLVGSTFAWFTDTATTGVNTIQSGTLDIGFLMKNAEGKWETAEGKELQFTNKDGSADILWEPGVTFVLPTVKLVNNGNLGFKYQLIVNGISGDLELATVLDVIVNDVYLKKTDGTNVTLADLMVDPDGVAYGIILPYGKQPDANASEEAKKLTVIGETAEYTLALHMQEEAGNKYQDMYLEGMTLTAYASQYTYEYDSFNNKYDKEAVSSYVSKSSQLKDALTTGGDILVGADVDLSEPVTVTSDTTLILDGNSMTVGEGSIKVADGAKLTVVDGTMEFKAKGGKKAIEVTNSTPDTATVLNLENVVINLEAPNYENELSNNIYVSAEEGEAVVNIGEGTEIASAAEHHALVYVGKNSTVNMTDGLLDLSNIDPDGAWTSVWGVYLDDATATFNMSGGAINVSGTHSASGIYEYGSNPTVNISGGVINVEMNADCTGFGIGVEMYSGNFSFTGGTINVKSPEKCKYESEALYVGKNVNVTKLNKNAVVNLYHNISVENVLCTTSKETTFEEGITVNKISAVAEDSSALADAIENAQAGDTVVLGTDVTITDTLELENAGDVTIDLAGNKLTLGDELGATDGLVVSEGATVNLINTNAEKTVVEYLGTNTNSDAIYVNGGTLNIGGNIDVVTTPAANSAIHATAGANVTISEGANVVVKGLTNNQFTAVYIDGASTVNMTGGTITVESNLTKDDDSWNNDAVGIMILGSGSTFNMSGGTVNVHSKNAMAQAIQISTYNGAGDSTFNITGGTFNVTNEGDKGSSCAFAIFDPSKGCVNVKDATFNGVYTEAVSTYYSGTPNINISGGTYAFDPSDYVVEGYKVVDNNGSFSVVAE